MIPWYLVGAVVSWPVLAWPVACELLDEGSDAVDRVFVVFLAACVAAVWPLGLAALPVWWLVRRVSAKGGEQQ